MMAQCSKIEIIIQRLENQNQYYDKKEFKIVPAVYEQNYKIATNFSFF